MTRTSLLYPAVAALTFGLASVAAAQGVDEAIDTDGDGLYSYEELLLAYPDLTEETYQSLDESGDGFVDANESLSAAAEGALVGSDENEGTDE